MKYSIEGGSLPVVICQLDAGETMVSESGGRTWAKGDVETSTSSEGGVKKMFGRMLSGESLFMSKYHANSSAEIAFASSFPGRIIDITLGNGQSIICQKRAFMAATDGVELTTYFNKSVGKGLFGGEGFIMQKITGPGTVFLEIDGHCAEYNLGAGERIVCDTGVLAIMDESCKMDIEMVKGMKNMFLGGEGVFNTTITGPGKVYLQTMTLENLAGLLLPFMHEKK